MIPGQLFGAPAAATITLRDYQSDNLQELRAGISRGVRRQVLCLGTGAGKTVVACEMMRAARAKGRRCLFIVDRISLVRQTSQRLHEFGLSHGWQQASTVHPDEPIQVCSAQTLERRGEWPPADLVIVDECHDRRRAIERRLLATDVVTVGLSATPFRQGLGEVYGRVVNGRPTYDLIEDGWLVPLRVFAATAVDMTGAEQSGGEWTDTAAAKAVTQITGDIVSEWVSKVGEVFGGPVKTLAFVPTIDYGARLCERFRAVGVDFRHVTAYDTDTLREQNIRDFRTGLCDGLVCVEALSKGFDVPDARCLIAARPYRRSVSAHIQQLGRVMRPAPGKEFGLILDHCENYLRFAERTEKFWAEGCSSLSEKNAEAMNRPGKPAADRVCGCGYVLPPRAEACPVCGAAVHKPPPRRVRETGGTLTELTTGRARVDGTHSLAAAYADLWPHIQAWASGHHSDPERARKLAMATYHGVVGRWPPRHQQQPVACPPELARMLDGRRIRYLRGRARKAS